MQYAQMREMDISNGPGVRTSIFTQGCLHQCDECFNPETWDHHGGKTWTANVNKKMLELMDHDYIAGLSILGGDPFFYYAVSSYYVTHERDDMLFQLVKSVKEKYPDKTIWLWTGYTWNELLSDKFPNYRFNPGFEICCKRILQYIDVLVDGKYIKELNDWRLPYCGSSNQRVIDVQKSLKHDKVVLL